MSKFVPNYLKTKEEKEEVAWRFDHRYDRPNTGDYEWYDGERRGTLPRAGDSVSQLSVPHNPLKGNQ